MDECRNHCQQNPLCVGFTHKSDVQYCFPVSKIRGKIHQHDFISGLRACKKSWKQFRKKYFKPNEESIKFKTVSVSSAAACSLVADVQEFPAFVWKKDEGSCEMTEKIPEQSK